MIALNLMPVSYRAEVYIRGGFAASDAVAKDDKYEDSKNGPSIAPSISLDLSRVIETQSRLLQSEDLAREVVQRLGLEQLAPELAESHWLPITPHMSTANGREDPIGQAAAKLLRGLSVKTDPRTYMIELRYTGRDARLAEIIANAFVAEFLRTTKLQTLSLQRSSAANTLARQLAVFGDKHPKVMTAKMRLAAADDLLKKQLDQAPNLILRNAGENITIATAGPSRPSTLLVVAFLLLVGLMVGTAVALWLERRRWSEAFLRYYARPFA
jgi:uncharacterized protein involved in exopolysaccharide biosynthesis